jgi:hypothetical protein
MQANLWIHHSYSLPRFNPNTGIMEKAYLGKATFIRQLNAAGRHVAGKLDMEIIDYDWILQRWVKKCGDLVGEVGDGGHER